MPSLCNVKFGQVGGTRLRSFAKHKTEEKMTFNCIVIFNLFSFLDITHLTSWPFISLFVVPGYAVADALDIEREKSLASLGWVSVKFDVPLRATFCGLFCSHCYSQ